MTTKEYTKKTSNIINSFKGDYFFLSNFYESPVTFNGHTFQNNEAAFQAEKTLDETVKKSFCDLKPNKAKSIGRKIQLRPDWETVKEEKMLRIVRAKFIQNKALQEKLLATGDAYLEEGNDWGDKIWGTVNGEGQNLLGKILMKVRNELKTMLVLNVEPLKCNECPLDCEFKNISEQCIFHKVKKTIIE